MAVDHHHHHDQHHQHGGDDVDDGAMAEVLDFDAEVLHDYLAEVTAWVAELAGDRPRRRILDLGSGTGTGALALLQRFEGSEAIAMDVSEEMLQRLRANARKLGLVHRVRTVQADLDAAWPSVGGVDLVWASSSLHHMAHPDRVLRELFAVVEPGGVLVALELDSFPRFLPDDVGFGTPGLEERAHAALAPAQAEQLPHMGSDWGPRLTAAGFHIVAERTFVIELTPPLPPATARYAQASLRRLRSGVGDKLTDGDVRTLDTLLDSTGPDGVLQRDDLTVRAVRSGWVARRP